MRDRPSDFNPISCRGGAGVFDLIVRNANLPDGRQGHDIGIRGREIAAVGKGLAAGAAAVIDATGRLVTPPFVDPHFHLDATLSLGLPRMNRSGTLLEGIALWGELQADRHPRGARRTGAALLRPRRDAGPARHPQPCRHLRPAPRHRRGAARGEASGSRPISTCSSSPSRRTATSARRRGVDALDRALDMGVDVVGGIPHFERTMDEGARSVAALCRDRGRPRPAGRHALRRDRRSAVAPYRDAGGRDHPLRAAGPGRRLAPHLDALDGQLLRLQADPADRRGRRSTRSPTR